MRQRKRRKEITVEVNGGYFGTSFPVKKVTKENVLTDLGIERVL